MSLGSAGALGRTAGRTPAPHMSHGPPLSCLPPTHLPCTQSGMHVWLLPTSRGSRGVFHRKRRPSDRSPPSVLGHLPGRSFREQRPRVRAAGQCIWPCGPSDLTFTHWLPPSLGPHPRPQTAFLALSSLHMLSKQHFLFFFPLEKQASGVFCLIGARALSERAYLQTSYKRQTEPCKSP